MEHVGVEADRADERVMQPLALRVGPARAEGERQWQEMFRRRMVAQGVRTFLPMGDRFGIAGLDAFAQPFIEGLGPVGRVLAAEKGGGCGSRRPSR